MLFRSILFAIVLSLLVPMGAMAQDPGQIPFEPKLRVGTHPQLAKKDAITRQTHQLVADQLNRAQIGTPNDRIRYFQTRRSPKNCRLVGWRGMIQSVSPAQNGGMVIVLSIFPDYDGGRTNNELYESYLLLNGKVNYLGFEVPPSAKFPYVEIN